MAIIQRMTDYETLLQTKRKLLIRGRLPGKRRVTVSGAKNSAVAVLPAALLTDERCTLRNIPAIADVAYQLEILSQLGVTVAQGPEPGEVQITAGATAMTDVPYDLAKRLRGSLLLLGPL